MCLTNFQRTSQLTSPSDLRASISGKDLPEDIKSRLLAMHEENVALKESTKTLQEKLNKAKQVQKTFCHVSCHSSLMSVTVHQVSGQVV